MEVSFVGNEFIPRIGIHLQRYSYHNGSTGFTPSPSSASLPRIEMPAGIDPHAAALHEDLGAATGISLALALLF